MGYRQGHFFRAFLPSMFASDQLWHGSSPIQSVKTSGKISQPEYRFSRWYIAVYFPIASESEQKWSVCVELLLRHFPMIAMIPHLTASSNALESPFEQPGVPACIRSPARFKSSGLPD